MNTSKTVAFSQLFLDHVGLSRPSRVKAMGLALAAAMVVFAAPLASFAATLTWSGTAATWGATGAFNATYAAGSDLVFSSTGSPVNKTANNDQTAGSTVNSINFTSNNGSYGYNLTGNSIALTTNLSATSSSGSAVFNTVSLSMSIAAGQHTANMNTNQTVSIGFSGGSITGAGGITKIGVGTLTMNTSTNSYSGPTIISAGTVSIGQGAVLAAGGSNSALGSSSNAASNLIIDGGTLTIASNTSSNTDRLFSIGTSGGTIGSSNSTASVTFNNTGSMGFNGASGARTLTLTGTNTGSNTIAAVIGDNGGATALTKSGAGMWVLSGANTNTGAVTVNAGTLRAGVASVANTSGAFGLNTAVTMANAASTILSLNNFNTQIGSITGGGATGGNVSLGSATLTTGGDNTSPAAYAGVISGTGGLTKIGSGTQILNAANTYTGDTVISSGTLTLGASGSLATASVQIAAGATFDATAGGFTVASGKSFGGDGTAAGAITFASGANFLFSTTDTLDVTGNITFAGFSISNLVGLNSATPNGTYLLLNGSGLNINSTNVSNNGIGSSYDLGSSQSAYFDFTNGDLFTVVYTAVPEPSTYAAIAGAMAMLGVMIRRRSKVTVEVSC